MKTALLNSLICTLGRRATWRIGRSLYLQARADSANFINHNGERLMQRQLLRACSTNRIQPVIFDVGANVGDWSLSLLGISSECGAEEGLVLHCFEPVQSTVERLEQRLKSFSARTKIRIVPVAVSDQLGTGDMYVVGEQAGTNSLHGDEMRGGYSVPVSLTTVDAYCLEQAIPVIHYLKCDAEGHDAAVIAGARQLLMEGRIMTFQFEYNHRWVYSRHYLRDVFEQVKGLPYRVGKITPLGVELYEGWHPELERFFEGNYVLIHRQALKWYPSRDGTFDQSNTFST